MSPELKKYYEDRLEMMSSSAWREFIEDVQNMKASTNTINGIDDMRKLGIRQGEISIMDWIINLKTVSEETFEELQREDA